jgi:hypothetical protein
MSTKIVRVNSKTKELSESDRRSPEFDFLATILKASLQVRDLRHVLLKSPEVAGICSAGIFLELSWFPITVSGLA